MAHQVTAQRSVASAGGGGFADTDGGTKVAHVNAVIRVFSLVTKNRDGFNAISVTELDHAAEVGSYGAHRFESGERHQQVNKITACGFYG
jgi:hypothetical protein